MKILSCSDIHLRSTRPEKRIDNYEDTIFDKLEQTLKIESDIIVINGDLFDSWRASKELTSRVMKLFRKYNRIISTIYGQHDQIYRDKNYDSVSYGLLVNSGLITHLNETPLNIDNVDFYGCSFDQEIPEIQDASKFNVLSIHKMIIKDKKIWNEQTDYSTGKKLLKDNSFDLILSGDNHQSFEIEYKNKVLINAGSIMRNKTNQKDHKPRVVLFDTDKKVYEEILLDVKPFSEVFDLEKIEKEKESNKSLKELSELLKSNEGFEFKFKDTVMKDTKNESNGVKSVAKEVFN